MAMVTTASAPAVLIIIDFFLLATIKYQMVIQKEPFPVPSICCFHQVASTASIDNYSTRQYLY